jgi:hypothetical protein
MPSVAEKKEALERLRALLNELDEVADVLVVTFNRSDEGELLDQAKSLVEFALRKFVRVRKRGEI